MATHFSILAWRIPGTEEPGRLQSMGSQKLRHMSTSLRRGPDEKHRSDDQLGLDFVEIKCSLLKHKYA